MELYGATYLVHVDSEGLHVVFVLSSEGIHVGFGWSSRGLYVGFM